MANKKKAIFENMGERNIVLHISSVSQHQRIAGIARALSSESRLRILDILKDTVMSVQEIANTLGIPLSSTAQHIKTLESVGLVISQTQPGIHGSMRLCTCSMHSFTLKTFNSDRFTSDNTISMEMPVGHYYVCDIRPTCGLANEKGIIDAYDDVRTFYYPQRSKAQLLWFQQGFIEYRFPNICNPLLDLQEISFSMELCSEAPGYSENWPSDITLSINHHEITTYTAPGDFGNRRGKLTPASWPNGSTQYGILKSFSVRKNGAYMDGRCVNPELTLEDLALDQRVYISLRIEIKETAKHIGGINLFGEKFGDYPQGIIMRLVY